MQRDKIRVFAQHLIIYLQQVGTQMLDIIYHMALQQLCIGPRSTVGNVSGYRCLSDCNSRGREFDPSPVPYFHGD